MIRSVLAAVATALSLAVMATTASAADKVDASTITCKDLAASSSSDSKSSVYGATVILYWMAGYHATAEQGTVVDFGNLGKEFEQTAEFCSKNPGIGVMTASAKFMGENAEDATPEAVDLATVTCARINSSKETEAEGLGQILMYLSGYHKSDAGDTVVDMDEFAKSVTEIATYCATNPEIGLMTVADKFMSEEAASDDAASAQ